MSSKTKPSVGAPPISLPDPSPASGHDELAGLSRRALARLAGAGAVSSAFLGLPGAARGGLAQSAAQPATTPSLKGRIRQSVCKWCYPKISLAELALAAKRIGLVSVELIDPKDFPVLQEHGLVCAMVNSHPLFRGLAHRDEHEFCLTKIRESIDAASAAGFPNVITFSGMRKGISDQEGLDNSVLALKRVVGLAEEQNVTICMELLNSKVDHPDYLCDRTAWGFELVERVGSERFRLLYDIYHMQIMEGDVIRTVTENLDKIAHFHTAGVPGRHELDDSQELFYPAIVRAILAAGYDGFLGQEFIPRSDDPLSSLAEAVRLCDV